MTFADFGGNLKISGLTITEQKGITKNPYLLALLPANSINTGGLYTTQGSEVPLLRFMPSV
jgi:hypothetical protein